MLVRPSDLSADRRAAFEEFAEAVHQRALDAVESMLLEVDPQLAQATYELAFKANDALPKQERRPQLRPAMLAVGTADALDVDDASVEALLGFTVAIQEYYDILDDLVDGDVAQDREREAVLATQVLLPMALRRLSELGTDAVTYWTDAALDVVAAPFLETTAESPTPDTYRSVLERQRVLFGLVTGLAAVAAGCDEEAVDRAERVGGVAYEHAQLVLDYEQHATGSETSPWNAAALEGPDAVIGRLEALRVDFEETVSDYPDPVRQRLEGLVALDVDAWTAALDSE